MAGRRAAGPAARPSTRWVGPALTALGLLTALGGGSWFGVTVARSTQGATIAAASTTLRSPAAASTRPAPVVSTPPGAAATVTHAKAGSGPGALSSWADLLSAKVSIPAVALAAYGSAQLAVTARNKGCHLSWTTLAGIGQVESRHGTWGGAQLLADGHSSMRIIGVPLAGVPGLATVRDTDAGRLDGDRTWDHAVGPMQFLPASWSRWASDGDADGTSDPFDLDDAALAAGRYLCAAGGDLATGLGWTAAIRAYNNSDQYVAQVWQAANTYARRAG